MAFLKRRLLWRVRRKLIISYIFIGFVPAILIVAFFPSAACCCFPFSSYLVQTLSRVDERASSIAATTAVEIPPAGGRDLVAILSRREAALASEFPGVSFAVVPMYRPCTAAGAAGRAPAASSAPMAVAGAWSHVDPPTDVPDWVTCEGFAGLVAYEREDENTSRIAPSTGWSRPTSQTRRREPHALVRAIALPTPTAGYAVVVDLLINDSITAGAARHGRRATGMRW
jgi:hypothetical protein